MIPFFDGFMTIRKRLGGFLPRLNVGFHDGPGDALTSKGVKHGDGLNPVGVVEG